MKLIGRSTGRLALSKIAQRAAGQHHPIAILEIGDAIGEGRERHGIGAEKHLAIAMADRQRRAVAGADHQVLLAVEHDGEGEGAFEPPEHGAHRLARRPTAGQRLVDEMGHDLGVGLGGEILAPGNELVLQLPEILDDPVMDDDHLAGDMGMGIGLVGHAMGGPAGMADAGRPAQRLLVQPACQAVELAWRPGAGHSAVAENRDAGRVIAAIFEPPQRLQDPWRDVARPQYSDDAAHCLLPASFGARNGAASLARPQRVEVALDPVRLDPQFARAQCTEHPVQRRR